jgi:uncharacterized protein YndB with AHSA1/START domain
MPDIFHDFPIRGEAHAIFAAISTPTGLDEWWTKTSAGEPRAGTIYELGFGEGYDWTARVTEAVPNELLELQMVKADADWTGTRVRFELASGRRATSVHFRHLGWPANNEHYRSSCYCWAAYLRILRRHVEHGERVPYEQRLDV